MQALKTLFTALRSLVYMTGFLLFFAWVALTVHQAFDRRLGITLPAWVAIIGTIFMLMGGSLALACGGTFILKGSGTPAVFDPPRQFVALGPYKYVRNPMYIGGLMLLAGFGLYRRSASILLLSFSLGIVTHLAVRCLEEPNLERRFGPSYVDYKKSVNRWTPKWR